MKIKLLSDGAVPTYATDGSAAFDVRADIQDAIVLKSRQQVMVGTGIAIALDPGQCARVLPRSGHGGRSLDVHHGLIDSDYRGEIRVIVRNLGDEDYIICPLDRIAQVVIHDYVRVDFEVVDTLDDTARGTGGFGSTGTS